MENATDKTIINLRGYLALLLTKKMPAYYKLLFNKYCCNEDGPTVQNTANCHI